LIDCVCGCGDNLADASNSGFVVFGVIAVFALQSLPGNVIKAAENSFQAQAWQY
jgi:hypothetical protein